MTIHIKFFGHSAFEINYKDYLILIDPFITNNPDANVDIKNLKPNDILVTHAHADHLGDAIPISKSTGATISTIFETANYCEKRGANAQGVNIGSSVTFEWGKATWLPAAHSSSTVDGVYGGCASGILLEIDDVKIYHAGDTGLTYELKMIGEVYKPDVALLPVGGFYTMGPKEALIAVKWLGCKTLVPMHYNTFPAIECDIEKLKTSIESSTSCKCVVLRPNQSFKY